MTAYFIAPYKPKDWKSADSKLYIDPNVYRNRMLDDWPEVEFLTLDEGFVLQWSLFTRGEGGSVIPLGNGGLHSDYQIVSMDTPVEAFIFWHRKMVPEDIMLFLFHGGSTEFLPLTPDVSISEIEIFLQ